MKGKQSQRNREKEPKGKRAKGKAQVARERGVSKENRERNELEESVLHAYVRSQLPLWLAFFKQETQIQKL